MAKKKQSFELDEFGFDTSLDVPDFDFEPGKVKDDRNAVTKVASGVKDGFKDTVMSPTFIRRMIKDSLPKGYGSAMDMADESADTLKNLYNDAAKEIKPVVKDLKRVTKRMLPTVEGAMPRKMAERIKRWANTDSDRPGGMLSAEQMRESSLQAQLGEIFKFQTEQQLQDKAENEARDTIRDSISHDRHRDMLGQLDAMRVSLQQLANYQNKVDAAYQRKSLELQFRHYFVATDMLAEQKKFSAIAQTNLEGILKNTGLPDFVKLKASERLQEVLRNKFIDGLNDSVFAKRRDFIRNVGQKLVGSAKEKLSGFLGNVRDGLGMADAVADMNEMQQDMGGMGMSPHELGGQVAGGMLADTLGGKAGKLMRKGLNKVDKDGKAEALGNKLQFGVENAPQLLTDYARGYKHENGGFFDPLVRTVKDAILSANVVNNNVESDKLGGMRSPLPFNTGAHKSITEIIPGYLARIYRELQMVRTGNDKVELTSYDYTTNKFNDRSAVVKNVFKSVAKDTDRASTKADIDSLIKEIDPNGTLSAEQRVILGQFMLRDNMRNGSSSAKRLGDYDAYTGKAGRHADKFSQLFQQYFEDDKDKRKQLRFSRSYGRLGQSISDARKTIQDHVNTGNKEALEELGLIDPNSDSINMGRLYDYFYGDDWAPTNNAGPTPTPRRRRLGDRLRNNPATRQTNPAPQPRPSAAPPQPAPANPFHFDTSELIKTIKDSGIEVVSAIRDESSKSISQTINETLLRIEEQLKKGIATRHGEGGGAGPRGGRWWNRTLGQLGADAWDGAASGLRRARRAVNSGVSRVTGLAGSVFNTTKDFLKEKYKTARESASIFVKGEVEPRLLAARLKAGKYKDVTTGKIIETYKDIKGAVIDIDTGEFVLKTEDLQNLVTRTRGGEKLVKLGKWGFNKLKALGASVGGFYQSAIEVGKWALDKAKDLLDQPQDIYVKGKTEPVLLARVMKAQGYRLKKTGDVIERPSQIKGAVIDENGDVVLTTEEFAKGIFDKHGKPIRSGIAKLIGGAKDMAMLGVNKLMQFGSWVGEKASGMFSGLGSLFGKVIGKDGIIFSGGKTMVERLTEIRDLLQNRLPERKKHVVGDADGDGVREGSFQDLRNKRKKALADAAGVNGDAATPQGPKGRGVWGTIGSGIKGLYDRFRGKKKKGGEDDEDGDNGLVDTAENAIVDEAVGGVGKRMRRMGGKGLAKMGGRGLGIAASAYGAYSAYDNYKQGNYASAALDAGLSATALSASTVGVGATASAIGSMGGALLTGAGSLLAGIGAVISAPVVLGALAVAAVGVGAYYGYKYLTKKKLGPISKVRYAQYGFLPTDEEHLQQVFGLEDQLMKGVTYKGGIAQLDETKLDAKKLVDSFGIDLQDRRAVDRWLHWFGLRFKPVFLTHLSALNKINSQKTLNDVDSGLKPQEKQQYLTIAKFPEGPYDAMAAPFPGMKTLAAGPAEVKTMVEAAEAQIQKELAGAKPDATGMNAPKAAAVAATATAAAATTVAGQAKAVPKLSNQVLNDVAKQNESGSGINDSRGVITSMGVPLAANKFATGKIDAVTAIRYKTYGLKELVLEKVRGIDALEEAIGKGVTYGKGNVAKWEGSVEKLLLAMGPTFGVEGVSNNNAYDWLTWFNQRFLPTYMNYLTAIAVATNKTDPKTAYVMLKPQQLVDVAMVVYTTNGKYNGSSVSVWQIPASPWPGYELNSDVKSVEPNMRGLKEDAKKTVLQESTGRAAGKNASDTKSAPSKPTTFTGKVGNGLSQLWQGVKNSVTGIFGGPSAPQTNGGREILQPGGGSGGDINSIPKPTGKGTWGALKDTIVAAAKMVGVDEKLMATMAAIESGFDYTVKAASSSASGLYQFINDTWRTMLRKYGAKYGIDPNTPQTEPRANALMGAEYIKENVAVLKGALNRPLTDTDLYLAHFLGAGGAKKFLTADPKATAANLLPDAARANPSIFFDSNGSPRSVADVYAVVNDRVRNKGKQFGVDSGAESLVAKETPKAAAPAANAQAAPAAKATNALAVPVADQAPGVAAAPAATPKTTTPAKTEASAASAAPSRPSDPATAAMGAGFMSPRARDAVAQAQYQKDSSNEMLGNINTAVGIGNKIQQDQLDILRNIHDLMKRGAGNSRANQSTSDTESRNPVVNVQKTAQTASQAPVSMARARY